MSLIFSRLVLCHEHVFVHLNFLLSLLHGHLKLIFPILQRKNLIHCTCDHFVDFLNFELHEIMLDKHLLLLLNDLIQILVRHIVFEGKLIDCLPKLSFLLVAAV